MHKNSQGEVHLPTKPFFFNGTRDSLNLENIQGDCSVEHLSGAIMLVDKEKILKLGSFDENFFLYYEDDDFFQKCNLLKLKLYLVTDSLFSHTKYQKKEEKLNLHSTTFSNKDEKNSTFIVGGWHGQWSKFYYFKKNFGYFYGLKKTLPNFFKALTQYIFFKLKSNKTQSNLHAAEISGLLSSYILRKSYRRPKIK